MSRVLVVLLVLVALLAGALWYATTSRSVVETAAAGEGVDAPLAVERARTQQQLAVPQRAASADASIDEPASAAAREAAPTARDEELSRAHWVEGRVVFPPGTPSDEEAWVVAAGRDFEDGTDHRARVEPDGSFRVAFSEETRRGRLEIEARYLYLRPGARWKRASDGPFVLEPGLGGRVVARVLAPLGAGDEVLQGAVVFQVRNRQVMQFAKVDATALDGAAEVALDALKPEREARLAFDGKRWIGGSGTFEVAAGTVLVIELPLSSGIELAGRVVDEQGGALQGARVNANARRSDGFGPEQHRYCATGADGAFELGTLAPGAVGLRVELEGYEALELDLGPFEAGSERSDLELVLTRGGTIAGSVAWPDGSPAEASIELVPVAQTAFKNELPAQGKSDADGRFRISGLSGEAYTVRARTRTTEIVREASESSGPGRKRWERTLWTAEVVDVATGSEDVALTLSTGLAVVGRVVDDLGAPLDEFSVRATSDRDAVDFMPDVQQTYRDAGGAFALAGFTPGEWTIEARAPDHARSEPVYVTLPTTGAIQLSVPREARVAGVVLGPDGAPSARATVETRRQGDLWNGMGDDGDRTDGEGAFSIGGLQPGRVIVKAVGDGAAPSDPLTVELEAGVERSGLVLRLRAGATLAGAVFDRAGRPEAEVRVQVNASGAGYIAPSSTDAEGRFEMRWLAPGRYMVSATNHEGLRLHESVTLEDGRTTQVRLAPPSSAPVRLRGRLSAAGEPLARALVSAHRKAVIGTGGGSARSGSVSSDPDGRFELALPEAGTYQLTVNVNEPTYLMWSTSIEVPAVPEHAVDIAIPLGRVSGLVTDDAGRPLSGMPVQARQERTGALNTGSAFGKTGTDGRYEIVLPEGRHTIVAGGDAFGMSSGAGRVAERRSGVDVREGERVSGVDFVLGDGGRLEGSVRAPEGTSLEFASILSDAVSGVEPIGWAQQDGGFTIGGLPPGPHAIRASSNGYATREPTRVVIEAGEVARVELELVPAVLVRVLVRDAAGAQIACGLTATDAAGRALPCRQPTAEAECAVGPLAPGRYTLRATHEGKTVERTIEVAEGMERPLVELAFE